MELVLEKIIVVCPRYFMNLEESLQYLLEHTAALSSTDQHYIMSYSENFLMFIENPASINIIFSHLSNFLTNNSTPVHERTFFYILSKRVIHHNWLFFDQATQLSILQALFENSASIYAKAIIFSLLETFLLDKVLIQTIIDRTIGNSNFFLSICLSMNNANLSHNDDLFTSVILHLIIDQSCLIFDKKFLCFLYRFCVLSSILYSPDNFEIFLQLFYSYLSSAEAILSESTNNFIILLVSVINRVFCQSVFSNTVTFQREIVLDQILQVRQICTTNLFPILTDFTTLICSAHPIFSPAFCSLLYTLYDFNCLTDINEDIIQRLLTSLLSQDTEIFSNDERLNTEEMQDFNSEIILSLFILLFNKDLIQPNSIIEILVQHVFEATELEQLEKLFSCYLFLQKHSISMYKQEMAEYIFSLLQYDDLPLEILSLSFLILANIAQIDNICDFYSAFIALIEQECYTSLINSGHHFINLIISMMELANEHAIELDFSKIFLFTIDLITDNQDYLMTSFSFINCYLDANIDPSFSAIIDTLITVILQLSEESFNYDFFNEIIRFVLLLTKNEHTSTSDFIINLFEILTSKFGSKDEEYSILSFINLAEISAIPFPEISLHFLIILIEYLSNDEFSYFLVLTTLSPIFIHLESILLPQYPASIELFTYISSSFVDFLNLSDKLSIKEISNALFVVATACYYEIPISLDKIDYMAFLQHSAHCISCACLFASLPLVLNGHIDMFEHDSYLSRLINPPKTMEKRIYLISYIAHQINLLLEENDIYPIAIKCICSLLHFDDPAIDLSQVLEQDDILDLIYVEEEQPYFDPINFPIYNNIISINQSIQFLPEPLNAIVMQHSE